MCFGKKPKLNTPNMQPVTQNVAPPIANQTPQIETGADVADANRTKKRNPNAALSLFQIQLTPGAAISGDEPGAATGGQ